MKGDMIHREALHPTFSVLVHEKDVDLRLNETLKEWEKDYKEIQIRQNLHHHKTYHSTF